MQSKLECTKNLSKPIVLYTSSSMLQQELLLCLSQMLRYPCKLENSLKFVFRKWSKKNKDEV